MKGVLVKAYAKINLILDVLGKREDGYHEVEMIMQAISLHDLLNIKPYKGITVTSNDPLVPSDERNLAYQAARLILDKYPSIPGAEINIEKHIPVEAGLAGGSSDAAAVILGMNKLYNLNMDKAEMFKISGQLGSDIPFCITGPTAFAKGRGEVVEEFTPCPPLWVVLIKPFFGVKTAEVYRNLNISEIRSHPNLKGYLSALENQDVSYILNNTHNVLEYSTFKLYPAVQDLKNQLMDMGAKSILMSGSGPTIFTLFALKKEAQDFAQRVERQFNHRVLLAHTLSRNEINERVENL